MKFIRSDVNNLKFYLGQSAILSSRSTSHNFNNLWDAEVKVFSQWGEDGILDFICEKIGISKPNVIEIGAGNFIECNSRFIAEFRNANVIAVDGRSDLTKVVETSPLYWKSTLIPIVKWVTPDNINRIIELGEKKIGKINIFSIDLDGNDYWILQKANLSQVDIVLLEYNPIFGSKLEVSVPRNDEFDRHQSHYSGLYYGASLKAFIELLSIKGFNFIGTNRVGNNAFFVQNKFLERFDFDVTTDYEKYVDWRIRESRDTTGALTFLSGRERLELISNLPLLDLKTNRVSTIKNLFSING
jgi:hypothetical protein